MPPVKRDGEDQSPRKESPKRSYQDIQDLIKAKMRQEEERQRNVDNQPSRNDSSKMSFQDIQDLIKAKMRKEEERQRNVDNQPPSHDPPRLSFQEIQDRMKAEMRKQAERKTLPPSASAAQTTQDIRGPDIQHSSEESGQLQSQIPTLLSTVHTGKASEPKARTGDDGVQSLLDISNNPADPDTGCCE
ncbi:hypothetical protein KCU78_g5854, partial [Aureobasidium melanogenum]